MFGMISNPMAQHVDKIPGVSEPQWPLKNFGLFAPYLRAFPVPFAIFRTLRRGMMQLQHLAARTEFQGETGHFRFGHFRVMRPMVEVYISLYLYIYIFRINIDLYYIFLNCWNPASWILSRPQSDTIYPNTARLFQSDLTTPAELKSIWQFGLVIQCYSSTWDRSMCTMCNCCSEAQFHMHTTTWLPDPMHFQMVQCIYSIYET